MRTTMHNSNSQEAKLMPKCRQIKTARTRRKPRVRQQTTQSRHHLRSEDAGRRNRHSERKHRSKQESSANHKQSRKQTLRNHGPTPHIASSHCRCGRHLWNPDSGRTHAKTEGAGSLGIGGPGRDATPGNVNRFRQVESETKLADT